MTEFDSIQACIDFFPGDHSDDDQSDDDKSLSEDEHDAQKPMSLGGGKRMRIAIYNSLKWDNGKTLRVLFLGGSSTVQAKVKQYAVIWCNYANIKFDFVTSGPADIRISFNRGGSWSRIGKSARAVPANLPTMNFGWFNDNTPDREFSRTTLHEFGHAIGCVHEHQQPNQKIIWDKEYVYNYYQTTQHWSRKDVDDNIFTKYTSDIVSGTAWDSTSIMEYPIPAKFTKNGYQAGYNNVLSPTDIEYIASVYPFPEEGIKAGVFSTSALHDWRHPALDNRWTINFKNPYLRSPTVLLGLNRLDFKHGANIRIKSLVEHVSKNNVSINLKSWANTTQYSSGVSYLLIGPDNFEFQTGHFNTMDDHVWTKPQPKTSRRIHFKIPYDVPPKIVVFLSSLDVENTANCRVRTYVTDVTAEAFTIHIDSWAETRLWSAGSVWIAYPAGKRDIASGTYNTQDIRPWNQPRLQNSSNITFKGADFYETPTVFMALNSLDTDRLHNTRVALKATNVTEKGMTWHIDSWADSILYSAGVSYIAIARNSST